MSDRQLQGLLIVIGVFTAAYVASLYLPRKGTVTVEDIPQVWSDELGKWVIP